MFFDENLVNENFQKKKRVKILVSFEGILSVEFIKHLKKI